MNKMQIFKSEEFGEIRMFEKDKIPYICLSDVCKILDLEQVSRVKARLNKDGVITSKVIDSLGREQQATFINESNLYKLIFQSRKQEAEKFTEWVTGEVLPTIRKHGMYATEELLDNPDLAIKVFEELKNEKNKRKMLESKIEEQKPKVLFAETVETAQTSILIGDLAKLLRQKGYNIGQNRLFTWLRDNKYLIKNGERRNMPTQKSMEMGLFEIKERTVNNPDGSIRITKTSKVTGKGQIYFINVFFRGG